MVSFFPKSDRHRSGFLNFGSGRDGLLLTFQTTFNKGGLAAVRTLCALGVLIMHGCTGEIPSSAKQSQIETAMQTESESENVPEADATPSPSLTPDQSPSPTSTPVVASNSILSFDFQSPVVATGVVDEAAATISVTVPFRTTVTALVPIITHLGVSVLPTADLPQDFSTPVTYTVTAADGTTRAYVVTVLVADRDLSLTPDPAEYLAIVQDMEGEGTAEDPNQITNVVELQSIIADLDAHYVLANPIDASFTSQWNNGAGFIPMGDNSTSSAASRFTGTLNGAGFAITGLTINRPDTDNQGMFFYNAGTITNLRVLNAVVNGKVSSAILVVTNTGTISYCKTSGTVTSTGDNAGGMVNLNDGGGVIEFSSSSAVVNAANYAGGLVGSNSPWSGGSCTIRDSYATGNVTGGTNLGGLVGLTWGGAGALIERSYATGNVTGTSGVGGLIGQMTMWPTARNNYATGNVSGTELVGGLVGLTFRAYTPYSYSTGTVTASTTTNVGGFIGRAAQSQATSSTGAYWSSSASGQTAAFGSFSGGTSTPGDLTAEQMKQQASYSGWDFTDIWSIEEGVSPPKLRGTIP
jgi:hypothetical protein